ncbi:MAG TPA: thioredoxin-disulfide reductase [Patescibacteria group bacterium]|nr:thioredoxin-disulfide reductase [Patescibacteria group bacterium]
MTAQSVYKTIIIGSGPAGLTAALYAARGELKPLVIAGPNPGGQLVQTTEVENFPGFPEGVLGPVLMEAMTKQAERFGAVLAQESVTAVDLQRQPFTVTTDKQSYQAATLILATGAEANWLGLPNEQRLRGKGVSACATCDGFFFKGKELAVIGGGDSAMEEATFLTKFASRVTIIHRRGEFKASKIMLKRAQDNPKISFLANTIVTDVLGEAAVTGLKIKDGQTGQERVLPVQGMFLAIGHTPSTKIFSAAGVEVDERGYVAVRQQTQTNIPGVFVAGDASDPRYRQAVVAAGMGSMAALDAEKYLAEQEA